MSNLHNSGFGDFTRGGQVTLHFLRMIGQVITKFGLAAVFLYSIITFGLWMQQTTAYERYMGWRYVTANIGKAMGNSTTPVEVELSDGGKTYVTIGTLATSPRMHNNAVELGLTWLKCMVISAIAAGTLLFLILLWLLKFGRQQRLDSRLRGGQVTTPTDLKALMKQSGRVGQLRFAGMPLVDGCETSHILLTGSSGTGKTTGIHELLKQIKQRGDRAIVYSPSGDFISWFYDEKKDRVLNMFDKRCPTWNPWGECTQPFHFQEIAASLVPIAEQGEKVWTQGAQSLLTVLLRKLSETANPTLDDLMNYVSKVPQAGLEAFVAGTEVSAQLTKDNGVMGANIRSSAAIPMAALNYIPRGREKFTFREWIEGEDDNGKHDGSWLFLSARADQLDAARPILSTWLQIIVSRILSLSESHDRRIWLVIDELSSLSKINSLPLFVEQARKFGGCGVIGFQQFPQLTKIYGRELASAIVGNCSTWICFRQNDPDTAKFVSDKFGKEEIQESQQGLSYGINEIRDGVNLNSQRKERQVLMPSEVMALRDLEGYLKPGGDLPGAPFKLKWSKKPKVADAYIPPPKETELEAALRVADAGGISLDGSPPMPDTRDGTTVVPADAADPIPRGDVDDPVGSLIRDGTQDRAATEDLGDLVDRASVAAGRGA